MNRRINVVVNPRAAGARAAIRTARAQWRAAGALVSIFPTRDLSHVSDAFARAAADRPDALVTCGGDGMLHAALPVVVETGLSLGVLPAGTGNDFARALGVPVGDHQAAAALVTADETRPTDLARAGTRWYGTVLASGFDADVNARTNRMRWPTGRSRYVVATLAELLPGRLRHREFRLHVDDERIDRTALFVAIGNTASYGGGMRVCPGAACDDGLLHVTIVQPMSRIRMIRMFPALYQGTHVADPFVRILTGQRIRIEATDTISYADGEPFGPLPITIECHPGVIEVFRP